MSNQQGTSTYVDVSPIQIEGTRKRVISNQSSGPIPPQPEATQILRGKMAIGATLTLTITLRTSKSEKSQSNKLKLITYTKP